MKSLISMAAIVLTWAMLAVVFFAPIVIIGLVLMAVFDLKTEGSQALGGLVAFGVYFWLITKVYFFKRMSEWQEDAATKIERWFEKLI